MEAICSSETSVLARATQRNIPEDDILHSQCLKFYISLTGWALYRRRHVFLVRYEPVFIFQKTAFFIVTAVTDIEESMNGTCKTNQATDGMSNFSGRRQAFSSRP
jgi:hypothetical protein